MATTSYTGTLSVTSCASCGTMFGIDENLNDKLRETGRRFFCPNGHRLTYGEGENQKLERRLERANRRAASAEGRAVRAEGTARAYKGHLTRTKRRVAAGVCPCCNRTFQDLARHMETKHPDYSEA